jgi:hypothetical protein
MPACGGFALSCLWPWTESRPQEHGLHGGPANNGRSGREVEKRQGAPCRGTSFVAELENRDQVKSVLLSTLDVSSRIHIYT